jgi:hypothetical protein
MKAFAKEPVHPSYRLGCRLGSRMLSVVRLPVQISNTVCTSLEKIGDSVRETPDYIFASPTSEKKKRYVPKNLASGLFAGTNSMLKGFASGLSGIVMEPYRARSKGFSGITAGIGRGILGLVCKPVAGTLDFVSMTVRGANNTPGSFIRSVKRYHRKRMAKKAAKEQNDIRRSVLRDNVHSESADQPIWLDDQGEEGTQRHEEDDSEVDEYDAGSEGSIHLAEVELDEVLQEHSLMLVPIDVLRFQMSPMIERKVLTDDSCSEQSSVKPTLNQSRPPSPELAPPPPSPPPPVPNKYMVAARNWQFIEKHDDYRSPLADKKGGLPLVDKVVLKLLRDAGKEILKDLGRKILKGDFNLTTVSFPIKCMQPQTILHNSVLGHQLDALYMNRAAQLKDPVERLRLVVVSRLANCIYTSTFLKPLNPLLGETVHGRCEDGTEFFVEQTSHHPPVSHFMACGPKDNYIYSGYYVYAAKAGLNSLNVHNTGKRQVKFKDGQTITMNCLDERYSNTFIGTMRAETVGMMVFKDQENRLECEVRVGEVSGKPSDYLEGFIMREGKVISQLTGTFLGHLDFDGRRYWDLRHSQTFQVLCRQIEFEANLPSDSELRPDLVSLRNGNIQEAQVHKEAMEHLQREDRKLRSRMH